MTTIAAEPAELDRLRTVVANLANALGVIKYRSVSLADTQVIALEALAGAAQPAAEPDAQDAKRYRWVKEHPDAFGWNYAIDPAEMERAIDAAMEKP